MSELFPVKYSFGWDGKILNEKILGLDTETELIQFKGHNPKIVLVSISNGKNTLILKPHEVDSFFAAHSSHIFVCHNAAFDFWSLEQCTQRVWNLVESNRLHDTMFLDMLIRLAEGLGESKVGSSDGLLFPQNLGKLSAKYAKDLNLSFTVDKESPYRLRFGELLNVQDWSTVDPGFFEYAAADPAATLEIYFLLYNKACEISNLFEISQEKIKEYGPLTHHLQVKAAIALLKITRNGIGFNSNKVNLQELSIRESINFDIEFLDKNYPSLFQRSSIKTGNILKYTKKSNLPSISTKVLRTLLLEICNVQNISIPYAEGKTSNLVTVATSAWKEHKDKDPLIEKFLNLNHTSKLLSFFNIFQESINERIHPSYQVLMRTGRTSSSGPNIQQMPGDKNFRSLFIPRQGYKFAVIDYSFIELRTLAAICEDRYGASVLADTIRKGIDPHVYTAAMILGTTLEEFLKLKELNPVEFKAARQSAKALNFGIPGGLGAASLAEYAKLSYGVNMTKDEASSFRKKLIYKIYPELGQYLSDSILEDISFNLNIPKNILEGPLSKVSRNIAAAAVIISAAAKLKSPDDFKYDIRLWDLAWEVINDLLKLTFENFNHLKANAVLKSGGLDFYYEIFSTNAITMTGRVRGSCTYTQARNTPFQSLAADGAKRALWRLIKEKFFPVAFVHDEIVIEVLSQEEANRAKTIMEEEMFFAIDKKLPIECSLSLCNYWEK